MDQNPAPRPPQSPQSPQSPFVPASPVAPPPITRPGPVAQPAQPGSAVTSGGQQSFAASGLDEQRLRFVTRLSNGMFFVAFALMVGSAIVIGFSVWYRLRHFHEYAQLAPDWVTLFPLIGSFGSLVALILNWTANRLRKRERKRLGALFDAAEKTTQFSDLPSWMKWVKPDRTRPIATATRALTSLLLLTVVMTSAGMVLAAPPSVLLKATGGPLVGQPPRTGGGTLGSPSTITGPTHPDATPQLTEYPMPAAGEQPQDITLGPDGYPWYTTQNEDTLGHVSASGTFTEIQIPSTVKFKYLTTGPDGNLWCAGVDHYGQDATGLPTAAPAIFKVTPSRAITTYDLPVDTNNVNTYYPQQITAGPDGALWFAYQAFGLVAIGRITTSGSLQRFPLPQTQNSGVTPNIGGITAGPDGNVWFTETYILGEGDDAIARITPVGVVSVFPLPTTGDRSQGDQVGGIVTGPDGNLWFVEQHTNKVGSITPSGIINEFDVPGSQPTPVAITVANGSLWVALWQGLARVSTTDGTITEYSLSSPSNSSFTGIVASADGTLWIAEEGGSNRGQIGKVTH